MSAEQKTKDTHDTPLTTEKKALSKEEKAAEAKDLFTRQFIARVETLMDDFLEEFQINQNLTSTDRRRLTGAGVRNNGFMDKAFDIILDNPQFMPPHFDIDILAWNMREMEDFRQLFLVLQQFTQLASNAYLTQANHCYREALRIYRTLQEQADNRVPGAQPLFNALRTFFSRTRRQPADEPTYNEVERDMKSLLHGKADGEIVIKNETPRSSGGLREIIDTTHRGKSAFKETAEGSVKE